MLQATTSRPQQATIVGLRGDGSQQGLLILSSIDMMTYVDNVEKTAKNADGSWSADKIAAALLAVAPGTGGAVDRRREDVRNQLISDGIVPADVMAAARTIEVASVGGSPPVASSSTALTVGLCLGGVALGGLIGALIGRSTKKCKA
jgi:hypothetical protein